MSQIPAPSPCPPLRSGRVGAALSRRRSTCACRPPCPILVHDAPLAPSPTASFPLRAPGTRRRRSRQRRFADWVRCLPWPSRPASLLTTITPHHHHPSPPPVTATPDHRRRPDHHPLTRLTPPPPALVRNRREQNRGAGSDDEANGGWYQVAHGAYPTNKDCLTSRHCCHPPTRPSLFRSPTKRSLDDGCQRRSWCRPICMCIRALYIRRPPLPSMGRRRSRQPPGAATCGA